MLFLVFFLALAGGGLVGFAVGWLVGFGAALHEQRRGWAGLAAFARNHAVSGLPPDLATKIDEYLYDTFDSAEA